MWSRWAPGSAALTLALADEGAEVLAIEVDVGLAAALRDVVGERPNVRLLVADALAVDWGSLLSAARPWTLVANLPYNVATPLVADLLDTAPAITRMLVMVQREVGERLAASPGSGVYGAISVKVAYWAAAQVVGAVPASVFMPRPNVESVLVEITRRQPPDIAPEQLFTLVRTAFGQRRKMLRRSLRERRHGRGVRHRRCRADRPAGGRGPRRLGAPRQRRRTVTTTVVAPAKLTLTLRVVGVRPDGYHLLDAEMVTLDLADRLTLTPGSSGVVVDGPFAAGVPSDERNLAVRALTAVGRRRRGADHQADPPGGGLGGGSADAAAVLRWAGISDPAVAAELGADVPFCLVGGRARVTGIGELVEPLGHRAMVVTLVVPPLAVSTPAVYRAWDDLGGPKGAGPNDLESAAVEVEPRLAVWRDRIGELAGEPPVLAGSGSTWFLHGERDGALAALGDEGAVVIVARAVRDARGSATCAAGGGCAGASSCASSCASACGAS